MGDVGTGKTASTMRLLTEAVDKGYSRDVTVLEMAPEARILRGLSVGGWLKLKKDWNIRVIKSGDIKTPRLSAKDAEELIEMADHNRHEIDKLLDKFTAEPTGILFVNDISLYLLRGDLERLWGTVKKADTLVANGYLGERLREDFGTGVSARERALMEGLASRMDVVIRL